MQTAVGIVGVLVGLALLWTGVKRLRISSLQAALLSALDIAVLLGSVALLGSLGVIIFLGATVVAILAWSIYLAAKKEDILLYAATQCGAPKQEMLDLFDRLRKLPGRPLAAMEPLVQARLMSDLAQRARTPEEIELMVPPIAMLWVIHRPDLTWLASNFDRLLRLYGMDATESMRLADVVTAGTKSSAATFEEMVDALVAAAV